MISTTSNAHASSEVQRVLILIARSIVDEPAKVTVDAETLNDATVMHIQVAQNDLPAFIGSRGRVQRSLRDLVNDMGVKHKHLFALDITARESN